MLLKTKQDEMVEACGMYERQEKCTESSGEEIKIPF
jgi:hypothetical protein